MVIPAVLSEVIPPSPVALRRTSHSAVIASEAKQSIAPSKERMDCFVARAPRNDGGELCIQFSDLSRCESAISRRDTPEACVHLSPSKSEGAGNAGRSMHPQPRVQMKKAHERSHHGHTGTTRHSPRNGFTAYFALSPVTRLV